MAETPREHRVEVGSRFSWDFGPDEHQLRLRVMAFLLDNDIVPPSEGENGSATVLGEEHVFGDMVLRLTDEQAARFRAFLADVACQAMPYEERDRGVVAREDDDLRD